jgi:hypothetical protein
MGSYFSNSSGLRNMAVRTRNIKLSKLTWNLEHATELFDKLPGGMCTLQVNFEKWRVSSFIYEVVSFVHEG